MKLALILLTLPMIASANFDQVACEAKAEKAVKREVGYGGRYDRDGFLGYGCELTENRAAVICTVSASKGRGAANDTYQVILNKACSYAFRVELVGEE